MSKLLDEIRQQPEHIRHVMMWLCVVIVFSLVGFVWFRSTQEKFVAMLHPEEFKQLEEQRRLAREDSNSPLAGLWNSFGTLRASLGELVKGESTNLVREKEANAPQVENDSSRGLPLSNDK